MKLSLVVPCYNEEESIINFQNSIMSTFKDSGYDFEVIYVDDGSKDKTLNILKELYKKQECKTKVVSFSRNFGKESAIYAGIKYACGEYVSLIDADLQQNPNIVKNMVSILDENMEYDVVAAYQSKRNEGKVLSFLKRGFYFIINKLSNVELKSEASDFRTFRKTIAKDILDLGEYHRFSKGIFAWIGYNTHFIPYTVCERSGGVSKWSFTKLLNYAIEGIVGFSTKPLRIATVCGILTGIAALIYSIVVFFQKIIGYSSVPGYTTIVILILFLGAIQLFSIGIIGEYIGRIFEQTKNRPIFIAKEVLDYSKSDSKHNNEKEATDE